MQFKINCSCGKSYRANETMIGRRFTCQNCQQKLVVTAPQTPSGITPSAAQTATPSATPTAQSSFDVQCVCGKKYRVSEKHLGKRLKCAACGEAIVCSSPQAAIAPIAPAKPVDDLFEPLGNVDVAPAPSIPTTFTTTSAKQTATKSKPPERGEKKKKSSTTLLLATACTLVGIGAIAGVVYWSGMLGSKGAAPSSKGMPSSGAVAVAEPTAPASTTPPVPADDWAFISSQFWSEKYAYVEPRARLNADASGLHAALDAPFNHMELVYRHCLEGDFKMQMEMQVESMGRLNAAQTSPTFMGPEVVVGFLDSSTMQPQAMRIPMQPDQYSKKLSITIQRIGDQLTHDLGGPGATAKLPPTAKAGYVYILMCAPAAITIEKVDCVGRKKGVGLEVPPLTPLPLDDQTWTVLASQKFGDKPEKPSLAWGEKITVSAEQTGSILLNKKVRGDVLFLGKFKVLNPVIVQPNGSLPYILNHAHSTVRLVFKSQTSAFTTPLAIPIGNHETTFLMLRANKRIVLYCEGQYITATGDETGDFDTLGFELGLSHYPFELSDLQLYQSQ